MYTKNINFRFNFPLTYCLKLYLDFSNFLITYTFALYNINHYLSLSEGILYSSFIEQINNLYLNKIKIVFNNNCLCYDKIMYSNTVYNIEDV